MADDLDPFDPVEFGSIFACFSILDFPIPRSCVFWSREVCPHSYQFYVFPLDWLYMRHLFSFLRRHAIQHFRCGHMCQARHPRVGPYVLCHFRYALDPSSSSECSGTPVRASRYRVAQSLRDSFRVALFLKVFSQGTGKLYCIIFFSPC